MLDDCPTSRALILTMVATLVAGCVPSTGQLSPESTVGRFASAVRHERYEVAYALLSRAYQRRVPLEEFRRHLREHPEEAQELSGLLGHLEGDSEVSATVAYDDGEELRLVLEDGEWHVVGNVVDFYDQSTPRAALRSFVRAMTRRRYEVVMRFVPQADLEGMSEDQMREAWRGDGREDIERLIARLRSGIDNPIERVGDRATMAYGERYTVQFVLEDEVWKIEDPD